MVMEHDDLPVVRGAHSASPESHANGHDDAVEATARKVANVAIGDEDSEEEEGAREEPPEGKAERLRKKKKKKKKKGSKSKSEGKPEGVGGWLPPLPSQRLFESSQKWRIEVNAQRGRCAVSTRDLPAGETVMAEKALVFLPRELYAGAICHNCARCFKENEPIAECVTCSYTVFCNLCKVAGEEKHKKLCGLQKQIAGIAAETDCMPDLLRLVAAMALIPLGREMGRASEGDRMAGFIKDDIVHASFQDAWALQTHYEDSSQEWKASVRKGCERLHETILSFLPKLVNGGSPSDDMRLVTVEEMEHLAALANTNAHGMGAHGPFNTDMGLGIFPFSALLNHSCMPNCCFLAEGDVLCVRATRNVPAGTELCLSYINLYEPREVRQATLMATKHFTCSCPRCSAPLATSTDRFMEGILCNAGGCKGLLLRHSSLYPEKGLSATWQCDLCERQVAPPAPPGASVFNTPWVTAQQAQESMETAMAAYGQRKFSEARRLLEDFLTRFSGKLHPLHVLMFDALTPLLNCCRAEGDTRAATSHCSAILAAMEAQVPWQLPEIANFYDCLKQLHTERADDKSAPAPLARRFRKQAQEAAQRAAALRRVCHGV